MQWSSYKLLNDLWKDAFTWILTVWPAWGVWELGRYIQISVSIIFTCPIGIVCSWRNCGKFTSSEAKLTSHGHRDGGILNPYVKWYLALIQMGFCDRNILFTVFMSKCMIAVGKICQLYFCFRKIYKKVNIENGLKIGLADLELKIFVH